MTDCPPQQSRDVGPRSRHPTGLIADLLATECAPATLALRAQPCGLDVPAAAAGHDEVECEVEVFGGGGAETVRKSQVTADRHPGAAQAHRQPEAVAAARERNSMKG